MTLKQVSSLISALLVVYFFYWNYSSIDKPLAPATKKIEEFKKLDDSKEINNNQIKKDISEDLPEKITPEPLDSVLNKIDEVKRSENSKEINNSSAKIIVEDLTLPIVDPEISKINQFIDLIFELDLIEYQMKEYLNEIDKINFSDLIFEHDLNELKENGVLKEYLDSAQKGFKTLLEQREKLNYDDSLPLELDYNKNQEIQESWVEKIKSSLSGFFEEEESLSTEDEEIDKVYASTIESAKKDKIVENLIKILKSYQNNELKESDLIKITKKESKDFTLISIIFNTQMEFIEVDFSVSKEDAPFLREGKSVDGIVLLNEKTVLQFTANYKAIAVEEWFNFDILSYIPGSWTMYLKSLDIPLKNKNYKFCYEEVEKFNCFDPF